MRTIVYRASRLTLFYAVYLLACGIQAWHPSTCGPLAPGFGALNGRLSGYVAAMLMAWDAIQELRGCRLCFTWGQGSQRVVAGLLIVGVAGVLITANCNVLDVRHPLTGQVAHVFEYVASVSAWAGLGQVLKLAGAAGALLVLLLGRRPPGH